MTLHSVRQRNFYIGTNVYSRCEVVAMEWLVQEILSFQCFLPTIHNFLWYGNKFKCALPLFYLLCVLPSSNYCYIMNMLKVLLESCKGRCRYGEESQVSGGGSSAKLLAAVLLALNSCSSSCHFILFRRL